MNEAAIRSPSSSSVIQQIDGPSPLAIDDASSADPATAARGLGNNFRIRPISEDVI